MATGRGPGPGLGPDWLGIKSRSIVHPDAYERAKAPVGWCLMITDVGFRRPGRCSSR